MSLFFSHTSTYSNDFAFSQVHELLLRLLAADDPEVRAAAVFALGALIQAVEFPIPEPQAETEAPPALLPEQERLVLERAIIAGLLEVVYDGSPLVRGEVARAREAAAALVEGTQSAAAAAAAIELFAADGGAGPAGGREAFAAFTKRLGLESAAADSAPAAASPAIETEFMVPWPSAT